MGGIGDYIHYSSINYRKFGTLKDGGSDYNKAQSIFEAQRKKMLLSVFSTKGNVVGLEKYLNGFLYGREIGGKKIADEEWKKFEEKFYASFNENFANFGVRFENGNLLQAYAKKSIPDDTALISVNRIKQYINSIENAVKKMNSKGTANVNDIAKFNQAIDGLNIFLQSASGDGTINLKSIPESQSILNVVNKVLTNITFPTSLATGSALEHFLAAAGNYATEKANIEADRIVDSVLSKVVGQEGSVAVFPTSQFSHYVDINQLQSLVSKTWKLNEYSNLEMQMATQDKLDVILNWNGDTFNVTAKNYSLKDHRDLRLVSGSPLLVFLNGEDSNFINHWLNIVTFNGKESKVDQNFNLAHEAMKITILVKALTGQGTGKKGIADTFIVNNRSEGKIHVFSTKDIIDKVTQNLDTNAKFSGYPQRIKNVWVGGGLIPSAADAYTRITNLMALVSSYKISASINYDSLI